MNKKSRYHSRKFLNKSEGMAAIEVTASLENWMFESQVSISDCNRQISVDLSFYEEKDIKSKLDKLDLMIDELVKLKEFMNNNKENYINQRNKKAKAKDIESTIIELDD